MNCKAKVRHGKGQVVKGTHHTPINMRIGKKIAFNKNQSQVRSTRSLGSLSREHVMFKKQILTILGLIQKQSFRSASDLQAKKIMEIAKILKLKLRTKLLNQCLQ